MIICLHGAPLQRWVGLAIFSILFSCADSPSSPKPRNWQSVSLDLSDSVLMSGYIAENGTQYTVGGAPNRGVIMTKANGGWSLQHEPSEMLHWIHGSGSTIWSVGAKGTAYRLTDDGQTLATEVTNTELDLWGVWVFSATNVWMVGGNPRAAAQTEAVIIHFDGETWQTIELPELDRPCPSLFKVWGQNPESIYFVGANGVLLHWNGDTIRQIVVDVGDDLVALWGDQDRVLVVGGRIRGVILSYDGGAWRTHLLPMTSGLNGIWLGDETAIAVGHRGMIVEMRTSNIPEAIVTQPTTTLLHGIFGTSDRGLTAVGGTLDQPLPWSPVLLETPSP